MSTNLVRFTTEDGPRWGVVDGASVFPLPADLTTTEDVLGEGVKIAQALVQADGGARPLPLVGRSLLPPVPEARIFCQGANYPEHVRESGLDTSRAFNMLFTKSSASLSGPNDDIARPPNVRLLDYEIELGIVLGRSITAPVTITDDELADYVGGFVVANDVSARDVQLPQGQWFKGKSYRTFCPVGPYLCIPDRHEVGRWRELRLTLWVNGAPRQDGRAGDMMFDPAATLTELSQLERLQVGDLLLTGTPGGVALQPPPAVVQRIGGLLPEAKRWQLFLKGQLRSSAYLQPGDRVVASIRTDDGQLDLGTQRNAVRQGHGS